MRQMISGPVLCKRESKATLAIRGRGGRRGEPPLGDGLWAATRANALAFAQTAFYSSRMHASTAQARVA